MSAIRVIHLEVAEAPPELAGCFLLISMQPKPQQPRPRAGLQHPASPGAELKAEDDGLGPASIRQEILRAMEGHGPRSLGQILQTIQTSLPNLKLKPSQLSWQLKQLAQLRQIRVVGRRWQFIK